MHWIPHEFALPKLPKGMKWYSAYDTDVNETDEVKLLKLQTGITVADRSIRVLIAK